MKKFANVLVVGGPIAAGKSSLVGALPFIPVPELDSNDELQKVLLKKMYEGDDMAPQIFQLDIMLTRFDKYKRLADSKEIHVFDRMIFEDKLFAWLLLKDKPAVWEYYQSIWNDKVDEIINEIGIPKLYIVLTLSWSEFEKRVFERNRKAEVENFEKNREYFKELISVYEDFTIQSLEKYEIPYVVIDTNKLTKMEVIDKVHSVLNEKGIA